MPNGASQRTDIERGIGNKGITDRYGTKPFLLAQAPRATDDRPHTTKVFDEIRKRSAALSELITPDSLLGGKPPLVGGGQAQAGEKHVWAVRVIPDPTAKTSMIKQAGQTKQTVGNITVVTHDIDLTWKTTFTTDPEFVKQTSTKKAANTRTLAMPLFHELLHARIMMERDRHWNGQRSTIYQDYEDIMGVANSQNVAKEKQGVLIQIGAMMGLKAQQLSKSEMQRYQNQFYEFLVHEKFDGQTVSQAFGMNLTNARVAEAYSKQIAAWIENGGVSVSDKFWQQQVNRLTSLVLGAYDKIDDVRLLRPSQFY